MNNGTICERCHSQSMVNGKCTNCGFIRKKFSANVLPVGQFLNNGRYRIDRVLGEGGYGITYEATDLQQQRIIAVKEFFPAYALRREPGGIRAVCIDSKAEAALAHARLRFNQEAALLMALKNIKEIVTVHHSFEDNNTAYYTMDLLQGMDMQRRLQLRGQMSWRELSPIVIKILQALYATHQVGYIHRDVTPDNIFLLNNGAVQLIDFGNARRYGANQQLTAVVKDKFAPREQYSRRGKQGPWTDIYSLCVSIYYALSGVLPKKATERDPAEEQLPQLQEVADVPPEVSDAIRIGMSADENNRYQSIADFAYALYPGQAVLKEVTRQFSVQRTAPRQEKPSVPQQRSRPTETKPAGGRKPMLYCAQGVMKGLRLYLSAGQIHMIGRGTGKTVQYPGNCTNVSRSQCSVMLQPNGTAYVRDEGSSFGTAVNGQKLTPGVWKLLKHGDSITFGREVYIFY